MFATVTVLQCVAVCYSELQRAAGDVLQQLTTDNNPLWKFSHSTRLISRPHFLDACPFLRLPSYVVKKDGLTKEAGYMEWARASPSHRTCYKGWGQVALCGAAVARNRCVSLCRMCRYILYVLLTEAES